MKGKREREKYTQVNVEFQRKTHTDKKAFLDEQCRKKKEEEEGKTEWEILEISSTKLEIAR